VDVETHLDGQVCQHFQRAAELLAQRWMPQVIHAMEPGPKRYSDLKASIPKISDALLSDRLRTLEAAKIVVRTVEATTPVRVSYALTPRGDELAEVLTELKVWAERWATRPIRTPA
jgi:DNA-binding HxlR family transcriptional regulator